MSRTKTAPVVARTEDDLHRSAELPKELVVFYLLAPLLYAPVFQRNLFALPAWPAFVAVARNFLPFVVIPAALHPIYATVVPRMLARVTSIGGRLAVHAFVSGAVSFVAGVAMHPVFVRMCDGGPPRAGFVSSCVVMTWTIFLPALMVQELRIRNEAIRADLARAEQAALLAQIDAIQSRTHPHFLFNALNTVACLVREDAEAAERTIERLATVLRYAIQSARDRTVALAKEIEIVEDYLEIQRARFDARLVWSVTMDARLGDLLVPPMMLQPLVENAVLHGVSRCPEGGEVRVRVTDDDERIVLGVVCVLAGEAQSRHVGSGTSLADLRHRLDLLYGEAAVLDARFDSAGSTVEVRLPRRTS